MSYGIIDLRNFYNTIEGRMVKRIIRAHLNSLMTRNSATTLNACIGYGIPYVSAPDSDAKGGIVDILMMPEEIGCTKWPSQGDNRAIAVDSRILPFPPNLFDNILLVHALEHASNAGAMLAEAGRLLNGQGRLFIIVPNRTSLWARAEWSPFGSGQPFSLHQLLNALKDNAFVVERVVPALMTPPMKWRPLWRIAMWLERIVPLFAPAAAGVHIIEASKQLYVPVGGSPVKTAVRSLRTAGAVR